MNVNPPFTSMVTTVGWASAISVPWMTISGSLLANWWRNQPLKDEVNLEEAGL